MGYETHTHWQVRDETGRRKYLSSEERGRFLAAAEALAPDRQVLCQVLVFTGCRISEALALSRHCVDAEQLRLTIRTLKRRRTIHREVPVPSGLIEALLRLPVHQDGRFWCVHRSTAWRWIKRVMVSAQIAGPMATPKGLRHGFGIRAAGESVPLGTIQRWLGHASPITSTIYIDAVGVEERQFAERMW